MSKTKIEWATHTVNWLSGCTRVSPACKNCYAESMSERLSKMPNAPDRYRDGVVGPSGWTGKVVFDKRSMDAAFESLRDAKKPRRVFVNSMSDTFHESAPEAAGVGLADWIRALDKELHWDDREHVIMLLTKRPERMLEWQKVFFPNGLPDWVWIGVTVEDQHRAEVRIPVLLKVKTAGIRFLSMEPLLGPVTLFDEWMPRVCEDCGPSGYVRRRSDGLIMVCPECGGGSPSAIGWVIVGGESGPNARPTHPGWVGDVLDACLKADVPFMFKQWGAWIPKDDAPIAARGYTKKVINIAIDGSNNEDRDMWAKGNACMILLDKHRAGRLYEGEEYNGVPDR